ncbi:MAG: flagellar M-ring protein FliF [Gammaproteobacteria bacterium]|nr:flagellar M-ring protein FliF [Gammaproteobacteria bacterium]
MANEATLEMSRNLMTSLRPLLLLLGVAAAVAAGVAVMLWWQGPNWSLLYGNLSARDAGEVVQALQTAGIEYQLNAGSGAVMVPAEKVHDARLQLAAQGLPASSSSGLDLVSKGNSFGVSQFMENARYQYALETELGRTVAALRGVEAARVHLALPQQSAFVRDRRTASASVLVQLRQGSRLESEQVSAIVHLVASSIPELDATHVTVVDQQGRLLSAPDGGSRSIASEQFEAAQRLEESYNLRIEQMLAPLVGSERVRARTTIELDAAASEQAREQYRPESGIVRSEQISESVTRAGDLQSGGVPGALTNQPPQTGVAVAISGTSAANGASGATGVGGASGASGAAAAASTAASSAPPENSSRQATRNFEIDRTLSYSHQPGGRIKRVTVAVLLDNVRVTGADGKETTQALAAAQLEDITRLVKSAVGYDEARGDSVSVVNAAFRDESTPVTQQALPLWQRPWVLYAVRLALGAIVLLALALGVLRPLLRNLTASTLFAAPAGAPLTIGAVAGEAAAAGAPPGATAPGQPLAFEQQIVQARNMVTQDPKRVAQVVKTWVAEK